METAKIYFHTIAVTFAFLSILYRAHFFFAMVYKHEIVMQKVFNNPVELLFYQSKVKCYLFAYKWQPFTWSLTIPIACI